MDFTLGSMYWIDPRCSLDELREDMRRVVDNRITLLRIFILWEYVETEKGVFDFSLYDRFFTAAEEAGIGVMPTLIFYPPFYFTVEQGEAGNGDGARRYPCLDRPEVRAGVERFYMAAVRRYKDSPALRIWNLWNEPTDTVCFCPHSLAAFAAWLKRKYRTYDELKAAWAGEYYIFDPVLPRSMDELDAEWLAKALKYASRGRNTALRLDMEAFQTDHSAAHLRFLKELVRKADPVHGTHSNPYVCTTNPLGCGISPWKLAREQESTGASIHPHHMFRQLEPEPKKYSRPMLSVIDLVRSWADGKDAWIGEYQAGSTYNKQFSYTPRGEDIAATLYHSLARGLRGVIFWQWQSWRQSTFENGEFSLRNPSDGGPTERSEAVRVFGEFLDKYRPHLEKLAAPRPRVAILHSLDQFALDRVLQQDNRLPGQGNRHFTAAHACHQALVRAGIPCGFVTEDQLTDGVPEHIKVLILPHVRIIGAELAAALTQFVRRGGALWADGRCGFADRHFLLRRTVPGHGLDAVFGAREADEVAPFAGDELKLADGTTLPVYNEIQRFQVADGAAVLAHCNGFPAAVRNRFGDGAAELWGTDLAADPDADVGKALLPFVAEQGIEAPMPPSAGGEIVTSFGVGQGVLLAVFTSVSDRAVAVSARLPIRSGWVLTPDYAVLNDGILSLTLTAGDTAAVLIVNTR